MPTNATLLDSLPAMLAASAAAHGSRVALRVNRAGRWYSTTYAELHAQVQRLAAALVRRGVGPGDRVAIFADNSPEWTVVDLAVLEAAAITVTVYATSTPAQVRHLLRDSEAIGVFVGSPAQHAAVESVRAELPALRFVADLDADDASSERPVQPDPDAAESAAPVAPSRDALTSLRLADLLREPADQETTAELDRRRACLDTHDIATIVYTSGTTGEPKGACLSHLNLLSEMAAIRARFTLQAGMRSMCFLPLSHVFERAWTFVVLDHGMENVYVTDPKKVAEAMVQIRPDTFCSVPRLYDKVYTVARQQAGTGLRRRIFDRAVQVGLDVGTRVREGRPVPPHLAAAHALADRLVLHRVRDAVGGPKVVMASGGAPLRPEVVEFFRAAGLDVFEGFGLTETAPMISCNHPGAMRIGSVGQPIPGCEVRIGDDGEIQARGANVFSGYWRQPQRTAEAFVDGWFRTGDIGHLDEDGYLYVTDRLKDLIITAQGKNVAPTPLETRLLGPFVEAAVVVGDNRPYLVALLQPNFPELEAHAAAKGWAAPDRATLLAHPEVIALYERIVAEAGVGLARYEQVGRFRLLPEELTMDSGALTPTLKVKRRLVETRYAALVEEMYA